MGRARSSTSYNGPGRSKTVGNVDLVNEIYTSKLEESGEPNGSERTREVYCICKGPDNHSRMIACDGCDEWFHAECVKLSQADCDRIEKYICTACTTHERKTLWKTLCRRRDCENAARYTSTPDASNISFSMYCSQACGVQFFEEKLRQSCQQYTNLLHRETTTQSTVHGLDRGERIRGDPLSLSYVKALVDYVKGDYTTFQALGTSPDVNPPGKLDQSEALETIREDLFVDERKKLDGIEKRLVKIKDLIVYLTNRLQFVKLCEEKYHEYANREHLSLKDVCGFDIRLTWDDHAWEEWWRSVHDSSDETTRTQVKRQVKDILPLSTQIDQSISEKYMCTKARCEKHKFWHKLQLHDAFLDLTECKREQESLESEAKKILRRVRLRRAAQALQESEINVDATRAVEPGPDEK